MLRLVEAFLNPLSAYKNRDLQQQLWWPHLLSVCPQKASRVQAHITLLESSQEGREALIVGLDYLISISFVPDDEVFKISLDYWNLLVPDIYSSTHATGFSSSGGFAGFGNAANNAGSGTDTGRKSLYQSLLSRLRLLMISRMAKPEEVGLTHYARDPLQKMRMQSSQHTQLANLCPTSCMPLL